MAKRLHEQRGSEYRHFGCLVISLYRVRQSRNQLTKELRKPHEFQGRADDGRRDDIIDEEGAVVGQEDAVPLERVVRRPVCQLCRRNEGLKKSPQ